jgi:peptidoglycan/xylan/chitin deacetylase (PgdA/CDA1 family)
MKSLFFIGNIFLVAGLLLQACASSIEPVPTPIRSAVFVLATIPRVPSQIPPAISDSTATPTMNPSPTMLAAATETVTITPTPRPILDTPASLMLHRKNDQFDAVQFLREFISLLQQSGARVLTYRTLLVGESTTGTGRPFIISIDDIYLRYPIDPSVLEMIGLLREAGYPAVLGVVTEGDYPYPETVKTLLELQELGWEIASHSDLHHNLASMEKVAPKSIFPEIRTSLNKLESALGLRPMTLILPEGQMTRGVLQLRRTGVLWVVGISGGNQYDTRQAFRYVGREGPDGDARATFEIMLKRFGSKGP